MDSSEEAKKESTSKDNSNDNVVVASTSDSSLVDNNVVADVNLSGGGGREDLANLLQKCDDAAAEDPNKATKKATPARQKHRRVLSAVEGSAAQQFLLGELNNSSADSDVLGKTVQNSNTTISKMNSNNSSSSAADGEPNKSSSGLKITDLSQWNIAAQYKADTQHTVTTGGSITDQPNSNNTTTNNNNNNIFSVSPMPSLRQSYSPAPAPATSTPAAGSGSGGGVTTTKKYNIQWDPNGDEDDDGLVSGTGSNSNNIDESVLNSIHQQNHHLHHHHHHHHHIPLSSLGTFDASSSVAATAALSSCSQRSIMSQYSTDLEEEEEGAQDLFEEEDLVGEFVPDCSDGQTPTRPGSSSKRVGNKSSRSNTTNRLSWSSSSSNPTPTALSSSPSQARAQQIEHQRRLQQTSSAIAAKRKQMEQQQQQTATDQLLLSSLINHIDTKFQTIQQSQKDYFTRMMTQISLESNKKSQIEHRLHSQLLLQSESMIAMELKILRLEARVEKRERENLLQMQLLQQQAQAQAQQQQQQQQNKMRFSGGGGGASGSGFLIGGLSNIGGTTSVGISGSPFVDTKMLGNVEEDMGEEEEENSTDSDNGDNDDYYDDDQDIRTSNRGVGNRKKSSGSRVLRKIVASSAASLVSAVTATSGEGLGLDLGDDDDDLDDVHEDDDSTAASAHSDSTEPSRVRGVEVEEDNSTIASSLADRMIGRTRGGIGRYNRGMRAVVTGITADDDESTSTPTQSSSRIFPTLDSILHNPSVLNNSISNISSMSESVAISTRAVRSPPVLTGGGAEDENSTLATSVTSATLTSTVYTGNTYPLSRNTATNHLIPGVIGEHVSTDEQAQDHEVIIKDNTNTDAILLNPDNNTGNDDYIRSGSPLTLPSMSGVNSVSAASVISSNTNRTSASALTEVAVASSREFRSSRARAAAATAATRLQSPPPAEGIPELIVENNSDDINNESEDHDTKLQTQNSNIIHSNNNSKNVGDEDDIGNTSRSGSPLTVPSMSGIASVTPSDIQSVGTNFSVVTTVTNQAIAPSRDFRSRRAAAAAQLAASAVNEQQQQQQVTVGVSSTSNVGGGGVLARPLTNRVVSFVKSATARRQQQQQQNANVGSGYLVAGGGGGLSTSGINLSNTSASMENILEGAQVIFGNSASGSILRGEGDSLTVPDELDNLSVDALFAGASARWREEYEARLDAIQKRLS